MRIGNLYKCGGYVADEFHLLPVQGSQFDPGENLHLPLSPRTHPKQVIFIFIFIYLFFFLVLVVFRCFVKDDT
jgi:hypothetical protein